MGKALWALLVALVLGLGFALFLKGHPSCRSGGGPLQGRPDLQTSVFWCLARCPKPTPRLSYPGARWKASSTMPSPRVTPAGRVHDPEPHKGTQRALASGYSSMLREEPEALGGFSPKSRSPKEPQGMGEAMPPPMNPKQDPKVGTISPAPQKETQFLLCCFFLGGG